MSPHSWKNSNALTVLPATLCQLFDSRDNSWWCRSRCRTGSAVCRWPEISLALSAGRNWKVVSTRPEKEKEISIMKALHCMSVCGNTLGSNYYHKNLPVPVCLSVGKSLSLKHYLKSLPVPVCLSVGTLGCNHYQKAFLCLSVCLSGSH